MTYLELAQFIMSKMTKEQQNAEITISDLDQTEAYPAILSFVEEGQEDEFGLKINDPFLYPAY